MLETEKTFISMGSKVLLIFLYNIQKMKYIFGYM